MKLPPAFAAVIALWSRDAICLSFSKFFPRLAHTTAKRGDLRTVRLASLCTIVSGFNKLRQP